MRSGVAQGVATRLHEALRRVHVEGEVGQGTRACRARLDKGRAGLLAAAGGTMMMAGIEARALRKRGR